MRILARAVALTGLFLIVGCDGGDVSDESDPQPTIAAMPQTDPDKKETSTQTEEAKEAVTDRISALVQPRELHTAILLQDGRVLVAGGVALGDLLVSSEIYDPQTNVWADVGNMAGERRNHTATLLEDSSVLIVSGMGNVGLLSEVSELYIPGE